MGDKEGRGLTSRFCPFVEGGAECSPGCGLYDHEHECCCLLYISRSLGALIEATRIMLEAAAGAEYVGTW